MRRIISIILSLLTVFSISTITAMGAETKSEIITMTKAEYEKFNPDKEKEFDRKKYVLKDQKIISEKENTFQIVISGLQENYYRADETAVNPDNENQSGVFQDIFMEKVTDDKRAKTISEKVTYENIPLDYEIPKTYTVQYFDEETNSSITAELKLKSTDKSAFFWIHANNLNGTVTGYDSLYYNLQNSNVFIPKNDKKPNYSGFEDAILKSLNLNPDNYKIIGSSWNGETYFDSNGELCRNCIYEAQSLACNISAEYESEIKLPDTESYTALLTYLDEDNSAVEIELTYEKAPINKTAIAVGIVAGILILSGLIAVILMFLSKRKKSEKKVKI